MGKKRKIPTIEEILAEDENMRMLHDVLEKRKALNAKLDAAEARRAQRWGWLRRLVRAA
jgi:hypothetical protein